MSRPFIFFALVVIILVQRRSRTLPPGLAGARFVRLGYLRKMLAEGIPVQRCQLLPEEAFGDPAKAAHLIVVSHRWLHRETCDVPTTEHPEGLRLSNMLERLEAVFSPPSPSWRWRSLYRSHLVGGWDVLVFFDFMCLPQEPRTEHEQQVFNRCLADMVVLYSSFPVLVMQEVLPSVHGYFDSGWCYSEFVTAVLGRQLQSYSAEVLENQEAARWLVDTTDVQGVLEDFTLVLQTKSFVEIADAVVVKCIFHAFLLKRLLLDATWEGNTDAVGGLLDQLESADLLRETLDQPVDGTLNTLLHVAVQTGRADIVELLLARGASRWIRNLRGDAPMQWFSLPRFWCAAAWACMWSQASKHAPAEGGFSQKALGLHSPVEDV